MSLEEPRAPIVRIRKKKVKRKSKTSGIVHLPVRASRPARYSSLTKPSETQTTSRECCRHMFAKCLKIPGCKLVCLRCILPQCFTGNDSEEEEVEALDEGNMSQNRNGSEISPAVVGATGGAEAHEVEMEEITCDSTMFIPKPRHRVNDYKKEPLKKTTDSLAGEKTTEDIKCDITYIEVENVPRMETGDRQNNTVGDSETPKTGPKTGSQKYMESGSEAPVNAILNQLDKNDDGCLKDSTKDNACVMFEESGFLSEYIDCGENSDDSESKHYVNEDVLKICNDKSNGNKNISDKEIKPVCETMTETRKDTSLDDTVKQNEVKPELLRHPITKKSLDEKHVDATKSGNSHKYVNLKPSEDGETNNAKCSLENISKELEASKSVGNIKTMIIIQPENKKMVDHDGVQKTKDSVNEFQDVNTTGTLLNKNVVVAGTSNENDKSEMSECMHRSGGICDIMSLRDSKAQKINNDQEICVDDHDKLLEKTESMSDSESESLSQPETTEEDYVDTQGTDKTKLI